MPKLNAAGQIFNLDSEAGFNEGYLGASARVGLRSEFNANIEACHGFQGKLDIAIAAEAEVALKLLWLLKGTATGEAAATAGVELTAKADLNVFEVMGFQAKASAAAEAYAAGKLAVGLTFEDLANLARGLIDDNFLYDIFIAFLNEVTIRAGVWGLVSAGASAAAEISIRGSLEDDMDSGFEVEMNAHAALAVGCGYGFFGGIKLENPKRFYLYASERIAFELKDQLKRLLPVETHQILDLVPLVMPVVLNTSYELGQVVNSDLGASDPDAVFENLTNNFLAQLQRFILDRITEAALKYISNILNGVVYRIMVEDDLTGNFSEYEALLDRILLALQKGEFDIDSFNQLANDIILLFAELGVAEEEFMDWLSAGWLSFNAAEALRMGIVNAQASASASLIGMGKKYTGQADIRINNIPGFVGNVLSGAGVDPDNIDLSAVLDFLLNTDVAKDLVSHLPQLEFLMNMLEIYLDMTPGEVIEAALDIRWDSTLPENELYVQIKELLADLINLYITDDVFGPSLHDPSVDENLKKYIKEVILPSTRMFTDFALDRVDAYISSDRSARSEDLFDESFKSALSLCVFKVFTTNVIFIADIFLTHCIENVHVAFRSLAQTLETNSTHILVRSANTVFRSFLPRGVAAIPQEREIEAVRELVCNLCYAASEVTGPIIFNLTTKNELRRLYKSLFMALDSDLQNTETDSFKEFFDKVTECTYIPNPITVAQITSFQVQLAAKGLTHVTPLVVDALGLFALRVAAIKVEELSAFIEGIFDTIEALIESINKAMREILRQLERLEKAYQEALEKVEDILEDLRDQLENTSDWKDDFLRDLKNAGLSKIDPDDDIKIGLFEVAFAAASVLIGGCFDLIGLSLKIGLDTIEKLEDLPGFVQNVLTEFSEGIADLEENSPIGLPDEISLGNIEDACLNILNGLSGGLNDLAEKKDAEIRAKRAKTAKEEQKIMHDDLIAETEANESLPAQVNPEITFFSPLAFIDPKTGEAMEWSYGKEIPVEIQVKKASTKLICTDPKGIFIAINGVPLKYVLDDWQISDNRTTFTYSTTLFYGASNLRSGINVIECTIVQNGNIVQKHKVEFIMNPQLASLSRIILDLPNSNYNTIGDDHDHTAAEYISLKNIGNIPANLLNWLVSDLKRHQFILPEVRLLPQQSVRIHTGRGRDSAFDVYQQRKRAIWNNTGDLVLVVNERKVLVLYKKY